MRTTSGYRNVGIGTSVLSSNIEGGDNLAIGNNAGGANTKGSGNIFMGALAGNGNTTGSGNTWIGELVGGGQNGTANVAIGNRAGLSAADSTSSVYSVYLGANAGKNRATNNDYELYIQSQSSNTSNTTPLIYGKFPTYIDTPGEEKQIDGMLAINYDRFPIDTDNIPYTLAVNGKTITEEVQVMPEGNWPDYVFTEDYNLMPLTTLEAEIEKLGHLPGVPSAEEVEENGHALGQMDAILLEKIEELTLHLIDINNKMEELCERNQVLETRLSEGEDK